MVVAADASWGIGKSNALPWPKLRGDLQHFKRVTSTASEGRRNAIVMGRKTWQSKEVGSCALPNRLNIVVSRGAFEVPAGVVASRSLDDALAAARECESVFVVGGAGLLLDALEHPALRWIYLTRIEGNFECDIVLPDLDARGFVKLTWDGERRAEEHGVRYTIEKLQRG